MEVHGVVLKMQSMSNDEKLRDYSRVELVKQIESKARAEVIEEVCRFCMRSMRNNGDYSAVGAFNEVIEELREIETKLSEGK